MRSTDPERNFSGDTRLCEGRKIAAYASFSCKFSEEDTVRLDHILDNRATELLEGIDQDLVFTVYGTDPDSSMISCYPDTKNWPLEHKWGVCGAPSAWKACTW